MPCLSPDLRNSDWASRMKMIADTAKKKISLYFGCIRSGDLIRLKVNEQVYSGTVDPQDQHIHLVPIIQDFAQPQQQQQHQTQQPQ